MKSKQTALKENGKMAKVTVLKKKATTVKDESKKEYDPLEILLAKVRTIMHTGKVEDKKTLKCLIDGAYEINFGEKKESSIDETEGVPVGLISRETAIDAVFKHWDDSGLFGDLSFVESTLDILEVMSSGGNELDQIEPATARTLLNKARLTTQEVIAKVEKIPDLIKNITV